jgi:hypothetical protein
MPTRHAAPTADHAPAGPETLPYGLTRPSTPRPAPAPGALAAATRVSNQAFADGPWSVTSRALVADLADLSDVPS